MELSKKEEYINDLYNECYKNVEKFIAWLVDIHHFSVDGWIVRNLKAYIDSEDKLTSFFERYANVYKYDSNMLTQCSIDIIDQLKSGASTKNILVSNG